MSTDLLSEFKRLELKDKSQLFETFVVTSIGNRHYIKISTKDKVTFLRSGKYTTKVVNFTLSFKCWSKKTRLSEAEIFLTKTNLIEEARVKGWNLIINI